MSSQDLRGVVGQGPGRVMTVQSGLRAWILVSLGAAHSGRVHVWTLLFWASKAD